MTCAAKGLLPGQGWGGQVSRAGGSREIRFAFRPSDLDPYGQWNPLGRCSGWRPPRARTNCADGYATDDIFYLEVSLLPPPNWVSLGIGTLSFDDDLYRDDDVVAVAGSAWVRTSPAASPRRAFVNCSICFCRHRENAHSTTGIDS
eukprot:7378176-Prymnesium_polylepis.1